MPAFSADGHNQSIVPSVIQLVWCGWVNAKRNPSMPGRFFQPSIRDRLSGLSSGKLPRMPNRPGYLAAASSEIFPEFGSQPGGCNRQALTPAASMSRMHSSAVYEVTWRCDGLVGGPADQICTCASTINICLTPFCLPGLWVVLFSG